MVRNEETKLGFGGLMSTKFGQKKTTAEENAERSTSDLKSFLVISASQERQEFVTRVVNENLNTFRYTEKELKTESDERDFNVVCTNSGVEALKILQYSTFDMILCDYDTQYMRGWQFVKQFKNHPDFKNMPIILFGIDRDVIAKDQIEKRDTMKEYGITSILHYPFKNYMLDKDIDNTLKVFNDRNGTEHAYSGAKEALQEKNVKLSKKLFEGIYEKNKKTSRANLGMANVYKAEGDTQKQKQFLGKSLEYDIENLSAIYENFEIAVSTKDERLIDGLPKTLIKEGNEKNVLFLYEFVQILFKYDLVEKILSMVDTYKDMIGSIPTFIYVIVAKCHLKRDEVDLAFDLMDKLLKEGKKEVGVLNLAAVIYRKKNDLQKSLEMFFQALEVAPTDYRILFNVALNYAHLRDYEISKSYAQRVLKLAPHFNKAVQFLDNLSQVMDGDKPSEGGGSDDEGNNSDSSAVA